MNDAATTPPERPNPSNAPPSASPPPRKGAAPAPKASAGTPGREGMMLASPPWLVRLSNIGGVVAVVGLIYLSVVVTHRYLTRVVVVPMPSLAQLADSARRLTLAGATDTLASRPPSAAAAARPLSLTIGGESPADSLVRAGQVALGRGRWDDAWTAFGAAAADSANASANLAASLLAAWRLDEGAAQRALARATAARDRLSAPEQLLLDAHRRWIGGDIHGSDSVYRVLVSTVPDDPTAWYAAAFVHRHDGGTIDTALVGYGSPLARNLRGTPPRRLAPMGAVPALWRVLQLSPWHEAARLELARFAAVYQSRDLLERLAWGSELYAVEPATRLAMRVLAADARRDTAAWTVALRLTADGPPPTHVFFAARTLATSAGVLNPRSLWRAAELLAPLTSAAKHPPEIVAAAHAWRGQLYAALARPGDALAELHAAAALDSSLGVPLAAWAAWLASGTDPDFARAELAVLEGWSAPPDSVVARDWLHPHRGMSPHLRAYGIALLSAALGDTARVAAEAAVLDRLPPIPGDSTLGPSLAAALRAEVAFARADFTGAAEATTRLDGRLPPLWRELSPFTGRVHARYRRGVAQQRAWQNGGARAAYTAFFTPTVAELGIYRLARARFESTP